MRGLLLTLQGALKTHINLVHWLFIVWALFAYKLREMDIYFTLEEYVRDKHEYLRPGYNTSPEFRKLTVPRLRGILLQYDCYGNCGSAPLAKLRAMFEEEIWSSRIERLKQIKIDSESRSTKGIVNV